MDQTHREYVDYYRVRAGRANEAGIYPESAAIEQERYEALAACGELGDFKEANEKGDFGNRLAAAQVRDKARARLKHYHETEQTVRAAGEEATVAAATARAGQKPRDVMDLMTAIGEIENRTSINLIVDAATDEFYDAFDALEDIEVWEKAEVPDDWKRKDLAMVEKTIAQETADFAEATRRVREYKADWTLDHALVWEARHRRLIPVGDQTIKGRIPEHKRLVGLGEGGA
jgi:hypothetical protein